MKPITCIMCAYNEAPRILYALKPSLESKYITNIIIVDDASTDGTSRVLLKHFGREENGAFEFQGKQIILLRHKKNKGKTAALATGLKHCKTEEVFLCDADIKGFRASSLDKGIELMNKKKADMIVFVKEKEIGLPQKFARNVLGGEHLFIGERILKKSILNAVLPEITFGYMLESKINQYVMEHKMRVYFVVCPHFKHFMKSEKGSVWQGIKGDIRMVSRIVQGTGLLNLIRQRQYFFNMAKTNSVKG